MLIIYVNMCVSSLNINKIWINFETLPSIIVMLVDRPMVPERFNSYDLFFPNMIIFYVYVTVYTIKEINKITPRLVQVIRIYVKLMINSQSCGFDSHVEHVILDKITDTCVCIWT